jgi:hypothetical protein
LRETLGFFATLFGIFALIGGFVVAVEFLEILPKAPTWRRALIEALKEVYGS